ncbi:hypothetical protein AB0L14_37950 [Streptomyces sp. NPDC052727]|uniref:hypothetical protein n=1 Tax=Streptomyces sp. NPDC052727 TaxID=3154854 RepID=UPI003425BEC7
MTVRVPRTAARRRVTPLHHEVTVRHGTVPHALTEQLTTRFADVAIEHLDVAGVTRTAGSCRSP